MTATRAQLVKLNRANGVSAKSTNMLPILQFIFQDGWHFVGAFVMLNMVCQTLVKMTYILVKVNTPIDYQIVEREDDDEDDHPLTPQTV